MIQNQYLSNKSNNIRADQKLPKTVKFVSYKDADIKLTNDAIKKIQELKDNDENYIVRVIISGGGCQGFQYEFKNDVIQNLGMQTRDVVLFEEHNNLLIVFDLFSEFYIKGATINYNLTIMESGFKIENNPKAKASCGCKKSFSSDIEFEEEKY